MTEELEARIRTYAHERGLTLRERLGAGLQGIVYVAEDNQIRGQQAVKLHHRDGPYLQERRVYERLASLKVTAVGRFAIPRALRFDDRWRAIEMTVVAQPFAVDFGDAHLDEAPQFSPEGWAQWEVERRELFESRWEEVSELVRTLRTFGIHLVDVTPSNISFPEQDE